MIAHFVGGPLNGKERVLQEGQSTVKVYELGDHAQPIDYSKPLRDQEGYLESINEFTGEYRRSYAERYGDRANLPAVFVWMDERPFKFVVTVDAYPGTDREVAKQILDDVVAHVPFHHRAFTAGIKYAKVD